MKKNISINVLFIFVLMLFSLFVSHELSANEKQQISDGRLSELMVQIFTRRENARKYVLEAEKKLEKINDTVLKHAVAGAIGGAVSAAAVRGGLTTMIIGAAIGALANITQGLVYEYFEVQDLFDKANYESNLADVLEKFVLENAHVKGSY